MANRKFAPSRLTILLLISAVPAAAQNAQSVPEAAIPAVEDSSRHFFTGKWNFFSDVNYSTQRDTVLAQDETLVVPELGVEWRFLPDISANVGGNYSRLDATKFDALGDYDFNGFALYGGLSYYLGNNFKFNLTAGYVGEGIHESTLESSGVVLNSRGLEGRFVDFRVYGKFRSDAYRIEPLVEYLSYAGTEAASINSDGTFRPRDPDTLGRLRVGGDTYRGFSLDDFYLEPMVHASLDYDARLLHGYREPVAFEVGGGFNIPVGSTGTTVALRDFALLGRDEFHWNTVQIALYHTF